MGNNITQRISGKVNHIDKHCFVAVLSHVLSFLAVLLNVSCMTLKPGHNLKVQDIRLIILPLFVDVVKCGEDKGVLSEFL